MINDSMKSNKLIGMIQPKNSLGSGLPPILHNIGCLGKIAAFKETKDGRYMIELNGLVRFEIIKEIKTLKKYREYEVDFKRFSHDLNEKLDGLLVREKHRMRLYNHNSIVKLETKKRNGTVIAKNSVQIEMNDAINLINGCYNYDNFDNELAKLIIIKLKSKQLKNKVNKWT